MRFLAYSFLVLCAYSPLLAEEGRNITPAIEVLRDDGHRLSVREAVQAPVPEWKTVQKQSLSFGFSKSVYWLKIPVSIIPDDDERRFVVLEWKPLNHVDFYTIRDGESVRHQRAGDAIPYREWSVSGTYYPTFVLESDRRADFYLIRLESLSFKSFPIKIMTRTDMLESIRFETGFIWFYGGLVVMLVLFSLFLFRIDRDRIYFYYIGYILSLCLSFNFTFGNGYSSLWGDSPRWQSRGVMFFLALQIFFSAQFFRRLLSLKTFMPRMDWVIRTLAFVAVATAPLTLTDLSRVAFSRILTSLYTIMIPAFYIIGIRLRNSAGHIRAFLIAWSIVFFFGGIQILYYFGVLPFGYITVYGAVFIFPLDFFFFAYSIWQRFELLRAEREKMQAEKREILDRLQRLTQKTRYAKSQIRGLDIEQVLLKLDNLFQTEQLYKEERLRLEDVAVQLGISPHQLSEVLNSRFGRNFSSFVNLYRVAEAQKILTSAPEKTALEIAYETGFGSKTRFNVEFKKATGMTPQDFRKNADRAG